MENQQFEEVNSKQGDELKTTEGHEKADKLSAVGWGLFFIWVGITFIANLDVSVALLGIGVITLGVQAARKSLSLKLEGFWVFIGLLFIVGGVWELFEPKLPLVPTLLIVAGLALILSVVRGKRS